MALFRFTQDADPVHALLRLQREVERAFERPFFRSSTLSDRGVFPPVNVFANSDHLLVRAEVPGIAPEDLEIEAQGRTLTIQGTRDWKYPESGSFHRRERDLGRFARSLDLPEDLDLEKAEATCKNGMLTIRIPKKEEAKPRHIDVQAA